MKIKNQGTYTIEHIEIFSNVEETVWWAERKHIDMIEDEVTVCISSEFNSRLEIEIAVGNNRANWEQT